MISVIIPTYNRAKVLPTAINSVLAQTYQDFEIIVVDDCSTDNTCHVMATFKDPRIRYVKHETNRGGATARNTGVKVSSGEFVAFLDSDDEWLSEKLKKQVDLMTRSSDRVGLISCRFKKINHLKKEEYIHAVDKRYLAPNKLLIRNPIGTFSVVLIRKVFLERVGGVDDLLLSCQDWDLYVRLGKLCEFDCVEEVLVNYYSSRSKTQISHNTNAITQGYTRFFEKNKASWAQLTLEEKVESLQFVGRVFIETGAFRKGAYKLIEAVSLRKTINDFTCLLKGLIVGVIIKIGLGNIYFNSRAEH